MTTPRNTILKLKGLQEWLAYDGERIHLTGERTNARPFTDGEAVDVKTEFERMNKGVQIIKQPWIILNAKYKNGKARD